MDINLIKEEIKLNEMKVNQDSLIEAGGDIIVPDIKPDIKEILLVEATPVVNKKEYKNSRANISGIVNVKVLYIPDNSEANVKSMNSRLDFDTSIPFPEADAMQLAVRPSVKAIEFSLINSRKLNCKAVINLNTKGYVKRDLLLPINIDSENGIEMKTDEINFHSVVCDDEKELVISDELSVPATKSDIDEIIKVDVKPIKGECKTMTDKILLKGALNVSTLYAGFDDGYVLEQMEHEIPFTEIVDIDGLSEDCICSTDYEVKDCYASIKEDDNGESRIVSLEVLLCVHITASMPYSMQHISDCFSTSGELKQQFDTQMFDELINEGTGLATIKEIISLDNELPEIDTIYDITLKPVMEKKLIEKNKLAMFGKIIAMVLYHGAEDNSVFSFIKEIPFEQTINIDEDDTNDLIADCSCSVQSTSYNLNSSREIEIRCVLELYSKIFRPKSCKIMSECELIETEENDKSRPSLVVYFAQKGDTMWEVAKRYKTTQAKIMSTNKMDDGKKISQGQKLLIPKK